MKLFTAEEFSLSTAEEEQNVFNDVPMLYSIERTEPKAELPAGTYRIIDDRLFLIQDGLPFEQRPIRAADGR